MLTEKRQLIQKKEKNLTQQKHVDDFVTKEFTEKIMKHLL